MSTLKNGLKANTKRKTRNSLLAKPQQRLDKSLPLGSMSVLRLPVCIIGIGFNGVFRPVLAVQMLV